MIKKVFLKITSNDNHKNERTWLPLLVNCITILGRMVTMIMMTTVVAAAPHANSDIIKTKTLNHVAVAWPPMKLHDIWSDDKSKFKITSERHDIYNDDDIVEFESDLFTHQNVEFPSNPFARSFDLNITATANLLKPSSRQNKVIHLFPITVDGECLSDDGRRTGTCFNAYECRNKGGQAKGECALGFGVCCIFISNCNETISNNITYIVSPSFPSFMPNNVTNCNLKIKLINDDISQLRIDFDHFILGQPNRRTGVCDGDVFQVSGGPGGTISLCGQNSGQHMYYDVGGRMVPRQTLYGSLRPLHYKDLYPDRNEINDSTMEIDLNINFAKRFLPTRLWEIRIAQIPFSKRAPAGCLQYFTGTEGILQTFNFADNGRHLANQNYRVCMRQEVDMCSIVYQPCDEQSFRIGPSSSIRIMSNNNGQSGGSSNVGGVEGIVNIGAEMPQMDVINNNQPVDQTQMQVLADDSGTMQMGTTSTTTITVAPSSINQETSAETMVPNSTSTTTAFQPTTGSLLADDATESGAAQSSSIIFSTTSSTTDFPSSTPLSDDVEGSGGGDNDNIRFRPTPASPNVSQRPRPTRGGFDLLGFWRSALDFRFRHGRQVKQLNERQKRQFYSSCSDRITMPCIVEDFIGTGLGPLPGCEPIHCGMQFCSNGIWPCRIESTVTPFYVGIHFGDGTGKGSAEDNIGACLRFQQVQCM